MFTVDLFRKSSMLISHWAEHMSQLKNYLAHFLEMTFTAVSSEYSHIILVLSVSTGTFIMERDVKRDILFSEYILSQYLSRAI